jgi:protocatechuate 3,4-dioxygenase beta subunit
MYSPLAVIRTKKMKKIIYVSILTMVVSSCKSQIESNPNQIVGGGCEGCEAIFEYGNKHLSSSDTIPKFQETEPKLKISGIVYQKDGKTPAENVILYIYQTNRNGVYETKGDEQGWAKRHGYIRGWIKTGKDGKYSFYTFRPASYPGGQEPEHIHITVKEPDKNEYYIDEYVFDDDPLLTIEERSSLTNRGGSGIMKPEMKNGILTIERNIVLGLNIPNYE